MSKASNEAMADLHGKVAKVMTKVLDAYMEDPVASEDMVAIEISPAFMSVVTKFLKDNNVTVAVEDSQEMQSLEKQLKENEEKRARRRVGNVTWMDQ